MSYEISERLAIHQTLEKIEKFKSEHGKSALRDAVANGAFHIHPDFGDVSHIFKERDFDDELVHIPLWISDLYGFAEEEEMY